MIIKRPHLREAVEAGLRLAPVTALLGPRQCGKTTLATAISREARGTYFDLEDPRDAAELDRPMRALESKSGLIVIDEVQRRPSLFPVLRVLADRGPRNRRFLILGSASPSLVRGSSETLAGRIHFVEMGGLTLRDLGAAKQDRLALRGGLPRSVLASSDDASFVWRENFIRTFLERDVPQLEVRIPAAGLRRFWAMVAHYHGQIWNATELAGSLGLSAPTARRYLDLLTGAFMVRQLMPWTGNLRKRLVKAPKVYLRDSGMLHALLAIRTTRELERHPKLGASWEGFALEQVLARTGDRHASFWATHGGAELDLVIEQGGRRTGFEFKVSDTPEMTKSMRVALSDLALSRLWVVYPGARRWALDRHTEVLPLRDLDSALA